MGELNGWSGKDVVRVLEKLGYVAVRQRGSHVRMRHSDAARHKSLTVPLHREVKIGLLRQIISDAGIRVKDFLQQL